MIFFIYILFILEIFIAAIIIAGILYCNKKVTALNNDVLENRYKIKVTAENIQMSVKSCIRLVKTYGESIIEKERKFVSNIIKSSVLGLVFFIASKKHKKQILFLELLMIAYETYKTSLKA